MFAAIASYIGPCAGSPCGNQVRAFATAVVLIWATMGIPAAAVILGAIAFDGIPSRYRELVYLALVLLTPVAVPVALVSAFWAVSATWIATLLGARELVAALLGPDPPPLDRLPRLERLRGALPA